jgi:anti-anti-sigma regulatory factor
MISGREFRLLSMVLAPRPKTIVCDLGGVVGTDIVTVDVLARFQLSARRFGLEIRLRRASPELQELIRLVGLDEVLRVEPGGQAEEREERLRAEEEGELGDPAA